MKYLEFCISNYRAIEDEVIINVTKYSLLPLVGINECGKTTILQALYCFDWVNDDEYNGKHLKDIRNLYKTTEKGDPIITAKIEIKHAELKEIYENTVKEYNEKIDVAESVEKNIITSPTSKQPKKKLRISKDLLIKKSATYVISVQRNLKTKKYSIIGTENIPDKINSEFAFNITKTAPYILYNDDFMDRVPNSIFIPDEKPVNLTGWLAIYERLFESREDGYSLFALAKENDTRRREAILSDVEDVLNRTLSKAWKTFSLGSNANITIRLKIFSATENGKKGHMLETKVVEKIGTRERYFNIADRSKGFLWFFNFVMKLEFNPKIIGASDARTVYLLDEPGSYLHNAAQEKLCSKLVDISKKHGTVIYCTHSHTLLNPEVIPLNHIHIVEKDKNKKIRVLPIAQVKTKTENNSAFQPIHEALQISAFDYAQNNKPILVVEGIYDKYAIQLMLNPKDYLILPSTNANSILKNIQFLNGYSKHYIAIWDNDTEGQKYYKEASRYFGEFEAKRFDMLPLLDKHKRRMEDMFEREDFDVIKKYLRLEPNSTYEKLITSLFYSDKKTRNEILEKVHVETRKRFQILDGIIKKKFMESQDLLEY